MPRLGPRSFSSPIPSEQSDPHVSFPFSLDGSYQGYPQVKITVAEDYNHGKHLESTALFEAGVANVHQRSEHKTASNLLRHSHSTSASSISDATDGDDISKASSNRSFITTVEQSLNHQIRREMIDSAWESQEFLPNDKVSSLITPDNILPDLEKAHSADSSLLSEINQHVCSDPHRQKLFAILSMMDKGPAIFNLIQEGINDKDLPFFFKDEEDHGERYLYRTTSEGKVERIRSFEDSFQWRPQFLDMFERYQWKFMSPFFRLSCDKSPRVEDHSLQKDIILPFIPYFQSDDSASVEVYTGGFSEVCKVKIHAAHHNHGEMSNSKNENDRFYAVKVVRRRQFHQGPQDEPTNLKRFVDKNPEHLIRLLLTFYQHDTLHLVFPWAAGNLLNFWEKYNGLDSSPRDNRLATWVARQMRGLADGLNMIHESIVDTSNTQGLPSETDPLLGRHGDLKPENILWFPDKTDKVSIDYPTGIFKISDFGLAEFHRPDTVEVSASSVGRTDTYRAPECDTGGPISQPYDLWSLGCVHLQFLTWYMCGWKGVEDFVDARVKDSTEVLKGDTFFNVEKSWDLSNIHEGSPIEVIHAVEKDSVHEEISKLRKHPMCTGLFYDILDIISHGLLVIDQNDRRSIHDTVDMFDAILHRCMNNQMYSTAPLNEFSLPLQRYCHRPMGHKHKVEAENQQRKRRPWSYTYLLFKRLITAVTKTSQSRS